MNYLYIYKLAVTLARKLITAQTDRNNNEDQNKDFFNKALKNIFLNIFEKFAVNNNLILNLDCENVLVKGNVWNTLGQPIFPELCSNFVSNKRFNPEGVSLAIGGGGSTAYTAMIGYLRALLELEISPGLNAFNSSQFISSNSGGSWFTGTYLFANGSNFSSTDLLGKYIEPSNINAATLANTNFDNPIFMGQSIINAPFIDFMKEGIKNGIKTGFLWNYAIGKIFLTNYNLFGALVSPNTYYASMMNNLNPKLPKPALPPSNAPFWICNAALLDTNIIENGVTQIQFTPLYSGFPQILGSSSNNTLIGGNWVDTYAFGCLAPNSCLTNSGCKPTNLPLNVPKDQGGPLTLENMIGTSSSAYAYDTLIISELLFGKSEKLDPIYNFWSPNNPGVNQLSFTGDGAFSDNTGILNLVSRNCKYILAFITPTSSFNSSETGFCSSSLLPLFGLATQSKCPNILKKSNRDSVQIFESSEWPSFSQQFLNKTQSGGPSYARAQLKVLPNAQNGVVGNYNVDLLVISLQPSSNFNSLLPTDITKTFSKSIGPFPKFPNYPIVGPNTLKLIELTKSQVNLLQSYTYWSINDSSNLALKNEIIDLYSKSKINHL
jgi:hypothetical protein